MGHNHPFELNFLRVYVSTFLFHTWANLKDLKSINTCFEDISSSSTFQNGKAISSITSNLSHHLMVKKLKHPPPPQWQKINHVRYLKKQPTIPSSGSVPSPTHPTPSSRLRAKVLNCWQMSRYHWWRVPEMSRNLPSRSNERALGGCKPWPNSSAIERKRLRSRNVASKKWW